ncbi:MAG: SCO family protein [Planctomycetes bacterium]|nr:SCO family protein [Planctomycetota bacterium]
MASWAAERTITILIAWALLLPGAALAQRQGDIPRELEGVGVDEKLDAQVDLALSFRDETGATIRLAQLLDGKLPVVLTLNYAACPMLCGLQLNGLVDTVRACDYRPGREFRLVTVSIDPEERPERAAEKKATYIERLGIPEAAAGWNFLVGDEKAIRQLADEVGFRYRKVEATGEYAHAAVSIVLTPEGKVSRYLYGVAIPEKTLKFSLLEAAEGRIGSTMDQILLFCFHYDAEAGAYAPAARKLMSIGGALVLLLVGGLIFILWRRERRRRSESTALTTTA